MTTASCKKLPAFLNMYISILYNMIKHIQWLLYRPGLRPLAEQLAYSSFCVLSEYLFSNVKTNSTEQWFHCQAP